jgi:hypothetical protein
VDIDGRWPTSTAMEGEFQMEDLGKSCNKYMIFLDTCFPVGKLGLVV